MAGSACLRNAVALLISTALVACPSSNPPRNATAVVGVDGGEISAGGATLTIPEGVLSEPTTITLTLTEPAAAAAFSEELVLGPPELRLRGHVLLTLPLARVAEGVDGSDLEVRYQTLDGRSQWALAGRQGAGTVTVDLFDLLDQSAPPPRNGLAGDVPPPEEEGDWFDAAGKFVVMRFRQINAICGLFACASPSKSCVIGTGDQDDKIRFERWRCSFQGCQHNERFEVCPSPAGREDIVGKCSGSPDVSCSDYCQEVAEPCDVQKPARCQTGEEATDSDLALYYAPPRCTGRGACQVDLLSDQARACPTVFDPVAVRVRPGKCVELTGSGDQVSLMCTSYCGPEACTQAKPATCVGDFRASFRTVCDEKDVCSHEQDWSESQACPDVDGASGKCLDPDGAGLDDTLTFEKENEPATCSDYCAGVVCSKSPYCEGNLLAYPTATCVGGGTCQYPVEFRRDCGTVNQLCVDSDGPDGVESAFCQAP